MVKRRRCYFAPYFIEISCIQLIYIVIKIQSQQYHYIEKYNSVMYSNYLCSVSKLVYLIGQNETPIIAFKKLLQTNNDTKSKYFFKFVEELPIGVYQKIKLECRNKGILRCDWFNKILDRYGLMIFVIFNYCDVLEVNQKWQDRLELTMKKVNKINQILKSYNREEQTILKVVIIISKEAALQQNQPNQNINVIQKICTYLKSYQKQMHIFQYDQLERSVNKYKQNWFVLLDKAYERKHRAIGKRKDEPFGQRKLSSLIKMAIVSEIINKRDSCSQYNNAYKALSDRFIDMMETKNTVQNLDAIREVRTLADIVLLRKLIVDMSITTNFPNTPQLISNHLRTFSQNTQNNPILFSYMNAVWRESFLQNLLEVLYNNDNIDVISKNYYGQLINSTISLDYQLCRADKQVRQHLQKLLKINPEIKEKMSQQCYIGRTNYSKSLNITQQDIIKIQLNQLLQKKKDYITRGHQTMIRYKQLKIFKKYQHNFFHIYLLRFYLVQKNIKAIENIFKQIIQVKISQCDFYLINYLIEQLEQEIQKSDFHQILIHSLAILISDYFKNLEQLEKYGVLFINSLANRQLTQTIDLLGNESEPQLSKNPIILPLSSKSNIFSLEVEIKNEMHLIEQPLEITVVPKSNCKFLCEFKGKATLVICFNKNQIQLSNQIDLSNFSNETTNNQITITINPLKYFSKDETLQISKAVLIFQNSPEIHFLIDKIDFVKCKSIMIISKLKSPDIKINLPYSTYYIKEISKFGIEVAKVDKLIKVDINFTVNEEARSGTEIFMDMRECLNLVNSNRYIPLSSTSCNGVYLRCNEIGDKVIKFVFDVNITQQIDNKELKNNNKIVKEVTLKVSNMFKTSKMLKQSLTGNQLNPNEIPPNKNIIMAYSFNVNETININEFGLYKRDKSYIKTNKDINSMFNFIINPDQTMKNIYMFQIKQEQLSKDQKKLLLLFSFYIKWSRIHKDGSLDIFDSQQIVNLYNEDQIHISLKSNKIDIQFEQGKILKKREKQTLAIKYRNLTNDRIHVYSMMQNSDAILRIGSKGNEIDLGPKEIKAVTFEILPIKTGYSKYPEVRSYFDGIQCKDKPCSSIICVQ